MSAPTTEEAEALAARLEEYPSTLFNLRPVSRFPGFETVNTEPSAAHVAAATLRVLAADRDAAVLVRRGIATLLEATEDDRDAARAEVERLRASFAAAPRLSMTMTPTTHDQPAQLVISNLDPLDLTAGETVVFRLVKE